ncbi:MAG TPA: hypothetical protein PLO23_09195, partial [Alphaproteobacteria bacterium]|nr:hypothetical protein [Alphaproteobacteria bacterium]
MALKQRSDDTFSPGLKAGLVPLAVCVMGVVLTSLLFILTNIFTSEIIKEEYEAIPNHTTEVLTEGAKELRNTIEFTAALIASQPPHMAGLLPEPLKQTIPRLNAFDQMIWLRKNAAGSWEFVLLHERPATEGDIPERIRIDASYIEALNYIKAFSAVQPVFVSRLPGLNQKRQEGLSREISYKPLIVLK